MGGNLQPVRMRHEIAKTLLGYSGLKRVRVILSVPFPEQLSTHLQMCESMCGKV